ncbi:MAG: Endolytic murein transglycosylase [Patescibacteria group bacterium]|nr:Endolytic murein transglycosylase [Patescibacteria group bacterium]
MKAVNPRRKRWTITLTIVVVAVILAVIGGVWGARTYYQRNLEPVSSSQTAIVVTIPTGSTVNQIADILKDKQLIRNSRIFTQYVRSQGAQDKLQAGTYSLRPSDSVQAITKILTGGNIVKNLFTILPGQRLDQIKSALINAGFDTAEVEQALDPANYKNHPALADKPTEANLEGYLYPDSYQRIAETKPQTIIQQSLDEMQKYLTPELRNAFVAQGLTVHQGIILASAVEQEVSKPEDRPIVAQVFLKRFRENMLLQSDVITKYGTILAGKPFTLTLDTPYNVYIHAGLPPGPISNISQNSMLAVANPAPTSWLYFVSGDDGTTYFSNTLEEHQALVDKHCKKLCE